MTSGPANLYAPVLGLGTLLSLALAAYGWRRRHLVPGGAAFTVFSLGVAIWTGVYILELAATGQAELFWANAVYFGIVLLPASWLVFALRYSGHGRRVTRPVLALLSIEPLATLVLAWTNPWHHWFRRVVQVAPTWEPAPGFWVHAAYSYVLILAGTVLIARRAMAGPRLGRGQAAALLVAALAPWAANAVYLSGLSPFGNLDPSPFGFLLTSVAVAWVLFRELEQRLVAAERRFRALVDHSIDAIEVIDPETGRFLDVNERACVARGYSREEYLTLFAPEMYSVAAGRSWEEMRDAVRRLGSYAFESEHRRKDGSVFPVEVNATYIALDRDYVLAVVRDVTDRKRAEAKFRSLLEAAPDAMVIVDEGGAIVLVNAQTEKLFGYARAELLGRPVDMLLPERFRGRHTERRLDYVDSPRPLHLAGVDLFALRKDGTEFPVEINLRPLQSEEGMVVSAAIRDITERRRAERILVESHSLLRAVVEGTTDAVYVKDLQGRYLMINAAGARLLGKTVEEMIGNDDRALFAPDTAEAIIEEDRRVRAAGRSQVVEETVTAAGVTRIYSATRGVYRDARGKVIGLIGIAREVTEMKRLEEQFRQSQKMEAVGRLAGGVAHDFNNILGIIIGYGELVSKRLVNDDPLAPKVAEILKAAERAAALTRQLLAFSRQQVLQPKILDLNGVVSEIDEMLRRLIGEDVVLVTEPAPGLGSVEGDLGQLQQVIMNLALNARDAMPDGGQLRIETSNVDVDEDYAARYPPMKPGPYVMLVITDTGSGMDAGVLARIFEPFFTTKELGRGTGLGLSTVYGIVEQSGGHIYVESEVGVGTSFRIYLPRVAGVPLQRAEGKPGSQAGGSETVLLVEDEANLRDLVREILEDSGYRVLTARDGVDALRVAGGHAGPIHVMVTDVIMPGVGGREAADAIKKTRPEMKVLYISGYTDDAILRHGVLGSAAFLGKPFARDSLLREVRGLLNSH